MPGGFRAMSGMWRRLKSFFLLGNWHYQDAVVQAGSRVVWPARSLRPCFPITFHPSQGDHQLPWDATKPTLRPHKVALCPTPTQTSARWAEGPPKHLCNPLGWPPSPPQASGPEELSGGGRHPQYIQELSPGTLTLSCPHRPPETPNPAALGEQAQ